MQVTTEHLERLTIVEQSTKSAHHRLDGLENTIEVLHEMNTNIKLLAEQNKVQNTEIKSIKENIKEVNDKVDELEMKPSVNYEKIKWLIAAAVISGVISYFISLF
jgi:methyl-accepting chemotaxis protein